MSANILDGKVLADQIKADVATRVRERISRNLPPPGLAVILVGNNTASLSYVGHKQKACAAVGILSQCYRLAEDCTESQIVELIEQLNQDAAVHGILLQLPLPAHIDPSRLLEKIATAKDVDGFHPYNMGRLAERQPLLRPCTPWGVIKLLQATGQPLAGLHAVVLGASNIVGRPMALELLLAKCTVTVCHRFTANLAPHVQAADILISAVGKPGLVRNEWIKPGAILIDVGFNHLSDGKVVGDLDFTGASQRAAWITPVPGGVGQMTVAMLLENTLLAAKLQTGSLSKFE